MCGGTRHRVSQPFLRFGLSPRVRGNRRGESRRRRRLRSIPACAGEPEGSGHCGCNLRVYPRVCGGTTGITFVDGYQGGLSPRVRGNPWWVQQTTGWRGSIPACAGEPAFADESIAGVRVYPRVCGGTSLASPGTATRRGLSPRVRGNLSPFKCPAGSLRSIPACAGEPSITSPSHVVRAVYPRVCGGTPGIPHWPAFV